MTSEGMRDEARYKKQGFGNEIGITGGIGLLIVDFVNGFADPEAFGGGNIPEAIERTRTLLAVAREKAGRWLTHASSLRMMVRTAIFLPSRCRRC